MAWRRPTVYNPATLRRETAAVVSRLEGQHLRFPTIRRVLGHFLGEPRDLGIVRRLGGELRRELTLSARANSKNDMAPGDGERDRAAMIGFDHRQSEVHTGGNAGRRPHAPILDVDGIAIDLDVGTKPFQRLHGTPMRRRSTSVESTSSR